MWMKEKDVRGHGCVCVWAGGGGAAEAEGTDTQFTIQVCGAEIRTFVYTVSL